MHQKLNTNWYKNCDCMATPWWAQSLVHTWTHIWTDHPFFVFFFYWSAYLFEFLKNLGRVSQTSKMLGTVFLIDCLWNQMFLYVWFGTIVMFVVVVILDNSQFRYWSFTDQRSLQGYEQPFYELNYSTYTKKRLPIIQWYFLHCGRCYHHLV